MHSEQLGQYTLRYPSGVFPLGGDTVALSTFATLRPHWRVCDLGTGSGALLLLLAQREHTLSLQGVELDPLAAHSAQRNLADNALVGDIWTEDLCHCSLPPASFDLIISNPPYFPTHTGKSGGPTRSEEACTLSQLCATARRLLRNGGRFALCHRPERLADVICALQEHQIQPKRLHLQAHSSAHPPALLLVEGVLLGKSGLVITQSYLHPAT